MAAADRAATEAEFMAYPEARPEAVPDMVPETGGDPEMPDAPCAASGAGTAPRRPRIAIMGEFSAGKSTLTNLLMGAQALPVRVTATQLPPVWMSHGTAAPLGVGLDGQTFAVDLQDPGAIPLAATRHLRVERPAAVLELCDLIDFPGISDPNMPPEVWERAAPLADAVLWLTHATQAWRQSEAAFWQAMPEGLRARSLLLLTRFDKIIGARDRKRVLARVRRETEGLFAGVYPVSLTRAAAAGDDRSAFEDSGAEAMMDAILDMITGISRDLGHDVPGEDAGRDVAEPDGHPSAAEDAAPLDPTEAANPDGPEPGDGLLRVVPRRVLRPVGTGRQPRPPADAPRRLTID